MTNEEFEVQIGKHRVELVKRKGRVYVNEDSEPHRLCRAVTVLSRAQHRVSHDVFYKVEFRLGNSRRQLACGLSP